MSRELTKYETALVGLAQACAAVGVAGARLRDAATSGETGTDAGAVIESCRASLLGALGACPELRDVFVVPARS